MIERLKTEFGIEADRAQRFTDVVRFFVSNPDYDQVFVNHDQDTFGRYQDLLINNLPETLGEQPGDTIECRWNNLMDELEYQRWTDQGVYLKPWSEHEPKSNVDPGVYKK